MEKTNRPGSKLVKCMNHDPEKSKWGEYAPIGGCLETIYIDEKSDRGLCWKCTSSSVSNLNGTQYRNED
jgi:hypothetical protein|tara:strand:- start:1057 stop:1263 length:207 start_codon:yes stop_codon:yes gene_type:complete